MRKKVGEHLIVDIAADYATGMISSFAVPQWNVSDENQFVALADYGPIVRFRNSPRLFVVTHGAVYYHDPSSESEAPVVKEVVLTKRKKEPIELTA